MFALVFSLPFLGTLANSQCYTASSFCGQLASPSNCRVNLQGTLPNVYQYCVTNDNNDWVNGVTGGSSTAGSMIDTDFLICKEGFTNCGYVPLACCSGSNCGTVLGVSGVTIGAGVDLGQQTAASLAAAGVSTTMTNLFTNYFQKQGSTAANYVCSNNLVLSSADALLLTEQVKNYYAKSTETSYNNARQANTLPFMSLPKGIRTVIASVQYQYGFSTSRYPNFWGYVTANDWTNTVRELKAWSNPQPLRMTQQGNIVAAAVAGNPGPNPGTPPTLVKFPSADLTPVQDSSPNYNDPNGMGISLFSKSAAGTSTKLSANFIVNEFVSGGGEDLFRLSPLLVECVQAVRTAIGAPLSIQSGYRSVNYNAQVNGAASSHHLSGTAADIFTSSTSYTMLSLGKVAVCQCAPLFVAQGYGIGAGLASTFVQIEFRKATGVVTWVEPGSSASASSWLSDVNAEVQRCAGGSTSGTPRPVPPPTPKPTSPPPSNCVQFPLTCLTRWISSSWIYDDPNRSGTSLFSQAEVGATTKLSNNFAVYEFASKDGANGLRLAPELVACLQSTRDKLGKSIRINSGYRSVRHNRNVGGASRSQHMSGTAADVGTPAGMTSLQFANTLVCECRRRFVAAGQNIGTGLDAYYLHVDMRPVFTTWIYGNSPLSDSAWRSRVQSIIAGCNTASGAQSSFDLGSNPASNLTSPPGTIETNSEATFVNSQSSGSGNSSAGGLSNGQIAAIVLGAIGFCALGALCGYFGFRNKSAVEEHDDMGQPFIRMEDTRSDM